VDSIRKNKLFLPIVLSIIALTFLGTSLSFIIANADGNDLKSDLADNGSLLGYNMADDGEQESEQQIIEEEAPDEVNQADLNEEVITDLEEENDAAEESNKVKEVKPVEAKPAETPAPQPVKNDQMARVTADSLNVRPDPSTNNERIDFLLQGQTVEVLGEQNNWLQVKLSDGRIGWISGAYVNRFSSSAGAGGSLAGTVIAIDPGHGGSDPGAVGVTGLQEKEVNLNVSLRVAEQLRAKGAKVIMTRATDVFIPLAQRVSIAEAAGAQVFVSVHANAHPNPQIGGTETYYFGNKATSKASLNLAILMQGELVGALRLRDIGVKDANFLVIRQTSMPSVLLELGFLSNAHEESLMRTNAFRQNSADAIVRALQKYFN